MNEDKEMQMVSVASIEVLVQNYVRIIKWLVVTLIVLLGLIFSYLTVQYIIPEEVVETREIQAEQDGDGIYLLGGGDVSYGTESNNSQN